VISVHYTVPASLLREGQAPVIDWTVSHRYSDFEALRAKVSGAVVVVVVGEGAANRQRGDAPATTALQRHAAIQLHPLNRRPCVLSLFVVVRFPLS
jgi:hypothetical protein